MAFPYVEYYRGILRVTNGIRWKENKNVKCICRILEIVR